MCVVERNKRIEKRTPNENEKEIMTYPARDQERLGSLLALEENDPLGARSSDGEVGG